MKVSFPRWLLLVLLVLSVSALACLSSIQLPASLQPLVAATQTAELPTEIVVEPSPQPEVVTQTVAVVDLVAQQDVLMGIYERVSPGVVSIQTKDELSAGQGSGFVIDKDGHIVTNFHVVHGATDIEVAFPSGLIAKGEIVGEDADSDLAVVKVDAPPDELFPLSLGDSEQLRVGQLVVAIGNPFGLSGTMTTGIISGLGRIEESLNESPTGQLFTAGDLIQTDAAINPGNSGGPLLNLDGEVIGVNRSIRTFNVNAADEPVNSGIGFAISVNIVKRVAPALIADGAYDYPYLGLGSIELTLESAQQLGLDRAIGVWVVNVVEGGPSDSAGILVDDVIVSIDGRELRNFGDLISYLFNYTSPGDTVSLGVVRGGEMLQLELVIGARP